MVFEEKGTPYMGKQVGKKLLNERARATQVEVENQQRNVNQAAPQAAETKAKVYLTVREKAKGLTTGECQHHKSLHVPLIYINSSRKDAGTTHKFTKRCIDKGHMDVCVNCDAAADPFDGCSTCGCKGGDLKYENIVVAPSQHEVKKLAKAEFKASRKAAQSQADQPRAKRRKRH